MSSLLSAEVARVLKPYRITQSQWRVLLTISQTGSACHGEIARALGTSNGNVTVVVQNLVKSGLAIQGRTGRDRRQVSVSLSANGAALVERIRPLYLARLHEVFACLTEESRQAISDAVERLAENNLVN